ncbi:MAG TPA: DUF1800 family protein, partial [Candidatus Binataceae bacterium]
APMRNFRPLYGTMQLLGMPLYGCQTPNGYANTQDAWLNPDAMMMRLSFATALGSGNLPLLNPPFEADGEGDRRAAPKMFSTNSATARVSFEDARTPEPARKMDPPDPSRLAGTLGGRLSTATASAIESAPENLRSPLMLGSPEFMRR